MRILSMIHLGMLTGLRGQDILTLKLNDINWKEHKIKKIQTKTKNYIEIPLTGKTMNILANYILNFRKPPQNKEYDSYIFLTLRGERKPIKSIKSINDPLRKLMAEAEIPLNEGRAFHSLRRYYATQLANINTDIHTISQLLGHKSIDSSRHYITFNKVNSLKCSHSLSRVKINGGKYYGL